MAKKRIYKHHQRTTEAGLESDLLSREQGYAEDTKRSVGKLEDGTVIREGGKSVRYLERYSSVAAAITAFGADEIHCVVSDEATLTANATFPENVFLEFKGAGSIARAGYILTINGGIRAPRKHIFTGSGTTVLGTGRMAEAKIEWWGAAADNTNGTQTDNAAPFNAALESTKNGIKLTMAPGDYGFLSGITKYERGQLIGGRKTRLRFYGSTALNPYVAVTVNGGTDGVNGDNNGGLENFEIIQDGVYETGTAIYFEGSIPAAYAHNVQRIICRDITVRRFEKALHFENVAYINAFYNIRTVNCKVGVYAKNAVNAVNFYGCYIDCKSATTGLPISNSYGVQYISDNDPTYYTYALNFFGGSIENVEHALYSDQNVPFTSQFFGTYFESGDIDLLSGHVSLYGCNTRHSSASHHMTISGSAILSLYDHEFGGSLTGVDAGAALVKVASGASYIEHGRTIHRSITGLTGRTDPKIYLAATDIYARYWVLNTSTGAEEGYISEFGKNVRFRATDTDDGLEVSNKTNASRARISSTQLKMDLSGQTATLAAGVQGSTPHFTTTRIIGTGGIRGALLASSARPTTDLLTSLQMWDTDLQQPLWYSGSGTVWLPASRVIRVRKSGVNMNNGSADVAAIVGLPAKYRVVKLTAYDASINLTTATISLMTASGGGGTAIVNAQGLTALTAATKFTDVTLAVTDTYQTASTLYIRNNTAQGSTATASFVLEILQLD